MAIMLKQKGTGDIYIYTELLAQRDDMEIFEESSPPPEAKPAKLTATAKPIPQKALGDDA